MNMPFSNLKEFLKSVYEMNKNQSAMQGDRFYKVLPTQTKRHRFFLPYGSCCIHAGAENLFAEFNSYIEKNNIDAEIIQTSCFGFLNIEPVFGIHSKGKNPIFFSKINSSETEELLDGYFHGFLKVSADYFQITIPHSETWKGIQTIDKISFFSNQTRFLLQNIFFAEILSLADYIETGGFVALHQILLKNSPDEIIEKIKKSGLQGRGGEGFPVYKKFQLVREIPSDEKFVICNAYESDSSSYISKYILENMPFRVLEGILISCYATGASKAYIFFNQKNNLAYQRLASALTITEENGFTGQNIFGSGFNCKIHLFPAPEAMICGEETALISCIEGNPALPRVRPPFPSTSGLWGKPTVINNIETLLNIPLILSDKEVSFQNYGTPFNKGTKLICITGDSVNKGIAEIELGTSLEQIYLKTACNGNQGNLKAILLGGFLGTFFSSENLSLTLDYEALKQNGSLIGSGSFLVMGEKSCIIDTLRYIYAVLQRESCGKCIPCREGTIILHEIIDKISQKPETGEEHQALERFKGVLNMENLAITMQKTSLCNFGKSASSPLFSALKLFRKEFEEHIFDRKCKSLTCTNLRNYFISIESCTGCGQCLIHCPVHAITGKPLDTHRILTQKCTGCGLCEDICKFNAVSYT